MPVLRQKINNSYNFLAFLCGKAYNSLNTSLQDHYRRQSMKSANGINLTMLCDFYELTMGNGYFV
ncbi:MAG: hypothetical protein ACI3VK_06810, partial [Oscillospiraceae bacterium]